MAIVGSGKKILIFCENSSVRAGFGERICYLLLAIVVKGRRGWDPSSLRFAATGPSSPRQVRLRSASPRQGGMNR